MKIFFSHEDTKTQRKELKIRPLSGSVALCEDKNGGKS
jgi:hypothetical protein